MKTHYWTRQHAAEVRLWNEKGSGQSASSPNYYRTIPSGRRLGTEPPQAKDLEALVFVAFSMQVLNRGL